MRITVTERKPPGISFTSWIDQQISAAAERGAFDDLPGAGKPIPRGGAADDDQAWLRDYLRREGVPAEELLPTPLKLRKEIERLAGTARLLRSEQEVRDVVAELNERIMAWRRIPLGPPIVVPLVDAETMVSSWQEGQAATSPASVPADARHEPEASAPARPRWWRRPRRPQGH
jgi:hypothetical protein